MAKIGDKIGIDGSRGFTHGCRDYAVLEIIDLGESEAEAEVVEVQSCTSCWQVGHDSDHVFAQQGDVYSVPFCQLKTASIGWATDVQYEIEELPS